MITATNPNTGERIMLQNGQWLPFQEEKPMIASNPDTGEKLIFRNGAWEPFTEEQPESTRAQGNLGQALKNIFYTSPGRGAGDLAEGLAAIQRKEPPKAESMANQQKIAILNEMRMKGVEIPPTGEDENAVNQAINDYLSQKSEYLRTKVAPKFEEFASAYPEAEPGFTEGVPGFLEEAATGITRYAPSMILGPASFAPIYLQEKGRKYKEYIGKGYDEKAAQNASDIHALTSTPVEFMGNMIQLKTASKILGNVGKKLGLGEKAKDIILGLAKSGIGEGIEEYTQAHTEALADVYALEPNASTNEIIKDVKKVWESPEFKKEKWKQTAMGFTGGLMIPGVATSVNILSDTVAKVLGKENELSNLPEKTQETSDPVSRLKADLESGDISREDLVSLRSRANDEQKAIIDQVLEETKKPEAEPEPEPTKKVTKPLRTPQERQQFINREFSTPEERQAIIDKEWAQEEAKMEKDIEAYTEQRRKEALKRFGLDRTSGDIAKLRRFIPMRDIQPEPETIQQEPTQAEKNQLLIDTLGTRSGIPLEEEPKPRFKPTEQKTFQMPFEGRQYRYLGESRTTGGEQVGRWQSQGKNGKWVNIKSLPRLRKLDNAKDEVENAERVRGNVEETGERVSPEGQAQAETGAVGRGSQELIRVRTPEDEGLAEETRVNVPRETSKQPWETGQNRPFSFDPNSTKNEGRFRLVDPDLIDEDTYFRRKSSTDGVSYVMGKQNGEEVKQAIRFDKSKFTEDQAAQWWTDNANRLGRKAEIPKQPRQAVKTEEAIQEPTKEVKVTEAVQKREQEREKKPIVEDIQVQKTKDETVVKTKLTPKEEKKLSLKDQKAYLLAEIDKAIEKATDEQEGFVKIEIPGDGTFTIVNRKKELNQFKKSTRASLTLTKGKDTYTEAPDFNKEVDTAIDMYGSAQKAADAIQRQVKMLGEEENKKYRRMINELERRAYVTDNVEDQKSDRFLTVEQRVKEERYELEKSKAMQAKEERRKVARQAIQRHPLFKDLANLIREHNEYGKIDFKITETEMKDGDLLNYGGSRYSSEGKRLTKNNGKIKDLQSQIAKDLNISYDKARDYYELSNYWKDIAEKYEPEVTPQPKAKEPWEMTREEYASLSPEEIERTLNEVKGSWWFGNDAYELEKTKKGREKLHRAYLRNKFNNEPEKLSTKVLESHALEKPAYNSSDWFARELYNRENPDLQKQVKNIPTNIPESPISNKDIKRMLDDFYRREKDLYESPSEFYDRDAESIAVELENDYQTYDKYLSKLPEDVDLTDIIKDYQKEITKPKKEEPVKVVEKRTKPPITKKPSTKITEKDKKKAERFRTLADNLQKQIDDKRRDMTQNPTPKRMKEYYYRLHEADNIERTQQALNAISDSIEAGTLPDILKDIKSKKDIEPLVRKGLESGGGYYDVIPSDKYSNTSEKGKALQNLLEKSESEEQQVLKKEREEKEKITRMEEEVRFSNIPGFFPTPKAAINTMLNYADIQEGMDVLEPSAGKGDIADVIKEKYPKSNLKTIEKQYSLRNILEAKGYDLIGEDFLEHKGKYDRIIQNPPFEKGQDIDHVRHAYDQLKDGGRLVSVMSPGPFFRSDKKSQSFREWFESVGGEEYDLGQAFKGAESFRQTGTSSKIVVIDKLPDIDQAKSRIKDSLKSERGSISLKDIQGKPVYDDLITLGKHYYTKGYTKLSDFAKQMKTALGDAWSRVSRLMKRIFDDVKVRLAEERGSIGGPIETKTPEEIDFFEKYFGTEVAKPETQVTIRPEKNIDIQRSTKDKIAFAPKSIDLSKEGIKNLTAKTYTSFFMQEYPVKRLARQFGPEVEKDIEEQIRRVRGTGGITESILTANSKTPFIELAKSGIKEYSHLGDMSLQRILKPLKTKEVYRDYERLREAERDIAFDKYRKEDIESGKLKGIDPENAKKVLSLLKQKYGPSFETLQDISRQHTRFEQDAVLKTLLKSGWMSQEQYDAIIDRPESEFYASYLREMEDVDRQTVGGGGDPVKRIYGSEKKKLPSAEGTIGNILRTVRLVERLRLNKKIVDLKELSDDLDDVIVERKPRFKSTEITFPKRDANNKFIKDADGKRVYQTRKVSVPVGPPANTVTIAEEGKKTYYELPPDILKAVNSNSYSANDMNTLFKLMSYPARLLRAGATLSAEFIARNPVRDQFSAFVYSKYGYNPFTDFAKGIFHVVSKTDLYKEFKAAGSENSYFVSLDRQAVNLRARDMTGQGNKIKYVKNPVEALRILSEFSEKGTRVGLYAKAKSKGATTQEAATEAREGTLDFGRIGQEKAINQIIAFWNASLQGTDKLFREMKNGRAVTKAVMGITLPSITLWLLNHDKERYKELPAWRKNFFWNIIIDDGPIISIPKPFELGLIFGSLPERILDWTILKDPDSLKDIAGAAAEGALPSVLPTAMLPAIEHITNYSFFRGQSLEPKSLENLPNYMRYSPYTTNLAKQTGKLIDVSPIKIENWVRDWTGSLGYSAMAGFDKVFMGDDIPDVGKDWYEVTPGVKGFISREPIGSGSKSVDKFYENAKEALSADAGYKFLSKHQNESESKAYAKKEKRKIALARGARKYLDNMASIRKQINSIIDNKEMEPSVKRKKIDALNKKITVLAKQFNKIYDNVVNK